MCFRTLAESYQQRASATEFQRKQLHLNCTHLRQHLGLSYARLHALTVIQSNERYALKLFKCRCAFNIILSCWHVYSLDDL